MIQTEGITKSFGSLQVLKGIDLTIHKSEIVSIVGPSGAGKTTLLQIIGTLDKPDSGRLIINETEVGRLGEKELLISGIGISVSFSSFTNYCRNLQH
jgi:lipoprotein-releasing system ATP-binding protein